MCFEKNHVATHSIKNTEGCITNFRFTTHCFFSTKKKACQEKPYRTEVVFEDKNFQFLSSKTTSVLKILSEGAF